MLDLARGGHELEGPSDVLKDPFVLEFLGLNERDEWRERELEQVIDRDGLPKGDYLFREFYCNEPDCDCRRVVLQVYWAQGKRVAATINYAFEPSKPPFDDEPQVFLDPLNPQSDSSEVLFEIFGEIIADDRAYYDRLVRPAFPRQEQVRREGPKIGPNEPCPCGSGKKYKRCCRP
ncbi:MAG TPA: SEC-C metal-binding domain-containing protein [Polyangiaceae bacterium]